MRAVLGACVSAFLASCGSAQTPSPSPTALGVPLVFYPSTGYFWNHPGFSELSNVAALNGGSCIFSNDDLNATFSAPSDQTNGSVTSVDVIYRVGSNAGIFSVFVDNGYGEEYVASVDSYAESEAWDAVFTTRVSSPNFVITLALAGSSDPLSSDSFVYFVGATVRGVASSSPSYTPSPAPSIIPSTYLPPGDVGAVTTIAGGSGAPNNFGVNDGVGTVASFAAPAAITLGPRNEYALVLDRVAHVLRQVNPATGLVTELAGVIGVTGSNDGAASSAKFSAPSGVAVNGVGSVVLIADTGNNRIRSYAPTSGTVSTVAGSYAGYNDGIGTNAAFYNPYGVALNADGSFALVADTGNSIIRFLNMSTFAVSVLAGSSSSRGWADGLGTNAQFDLPQGISLTADGILAAVADTGQQTIRLITVTTGLVIRISGLPQQPGYDNWPHPRFYNPTGVTISNSVILVADSFNGYIRRIDLTRDTTGLYSGTTTTIAGSLRARSFGDGVGTAALFNNPVSIAMDPANAFALIADTSNNAIRALKLQSLAVAPSSYVSVQTIYASQDSRWTYFPILAWYHNSHTPSWPWVFQYTNQAGAQAYFTSSYWSTSSTHTSSTEESSTTFPFYFSAVDLIYITDPTGGFMTLRFVAGDDAWYMPGIDTYSPTLNDHVKIRFQLSAPSNSLEFIINVDGTSNPASSGARIALVGIDLLGPPTPSASPTSTPSPSPSPSAPPVSVAPVVTFAGAPPTSSYYNAYWDGVGTIARFSYPGALGQAPGGSFYVVADQLGNMLRLMYTNESVLTLAGSAYDSGSADGVGTSALFSGVGGIAVVPSGAYAIVADTGNNVIRKVTVPSGVVTTVAGSAGNSSGYNDATGASALFSAPSGVGIDSAGSYALICDAGNNLIRKLNLGTSAVTTFAGWPGYAGHADGLGTAATFSSPMAIALSTSAAFVVQVTGRAYNNVIRRIALSNGAVTTLAGSVNAIGYLDAVGTSALFSFTSGAGIATSSTGAVVYVTDSNMLRRINTTSGAVRTMGGTPAAGYVNDVGTTARFNSPAGVATDSIGATGMVVDSNNGAVRFIQLRTPSVTPTPTATPSNSETPSRTPSRTQTNSCTPSQAATHSQTPTPGPLFWTVASEVGQSCDAVCAPHGGCLGGRFPGWAVQGYDVLSNAAEALAGYTLVVDPNPQTYEPFINGNSTLVIGSSLVSTCAAVRCCDVLRVCPCLGPTTQSPTPTGTPTRSPTPTPVFEFVGSATGGFDATNPSGLSSTPDQCGAPSGAVSFWQGAYFTYSGPAFDAPAGDVDKTAVAWVKCAPLANAGSFFAVDSSGASAGRLSLGAAAASTSSSGVDSGPSLEYIDPSSGVPGHCSAAGTGVSVCDGAWHQVAASYIAGEGTTLFIDAISALFCAGSIPGLASGPAVTIGWDGDSGWNGGSYFTGSVSGARLFDRALSAADLSDDSTVCPSGSGSGALALPPLGARVSFEPASNPGAALRQCGSVATWDAGNSSDFRFTIVPALNGDAAPAYSIQSTTDTTKYLMPVSSWNHPDQMSFSVPRSSQFAAASWVFLAGAADPALLTLQNAATGKLLVSAQTHYDACSSAGGDVLSGDASNAAAASWRVFYPTTGTSTYSGAPPASAAAASVTAGVNVGMAIGGAVGGIVALAVLVAVVAIAIAYFAKVARPYRAAKPAPAAAAAEISTAPATHSEIEVEGDGVSASV